MSVHLYFEMAVRTRAPAGRTRVSDDIALLYRLPDGTVERTVVTVKCDQSVAVAYYDAVTVSAVITRADDYSVSGSVYRRTGRNTYVDSRMTLI